MDSGKPLKVLDSGKPSQRISKEVFPLLENERGCFHTGRSTVIVKIAITIYYVK